MIYDTKNYCNGILIRILWGFDFVLKINLFEEFFSSYEIKNEANFNKLKSKQMELTIIWIIINEYDLRNLS